MAATKEVISFDDIIQADRKRRRNEALANEILGKGRRAGAAGNVSTMNRNTPLRSGESLASRVGIAKRSSSVATKASTQPQVSGRWSHDLQFSNNARPAHVPQGPRSNSASGIDRGNRIYASLHSAPAINGTQSQVNIRDQTAKGISIRGIAAPAGPFIVEASNFAPGTTAADIESAMLQTCGEIISCKLLSSQPTVIAQITFVEREGANNAIATFNNQKADGRVLHVCMKQAGSPPDGGPGRPLALDYRLPRPKLPGADPDIMEVDDERPNRERVDRDTVARLDRERRRPESQYEDGRYGFPERSRQDGFDGRRDRDRDQDRGGLYSDSMGRRPYRQ